MVLLRNLYSSRYVLAAYFALATGVSVCSAQCGQLPYAAPPIANASDTYYSQDFSTYGESNYESYGAYQPAVTDSVDQLYRSNATRPLGGLFAKGFTRTATVMGGANFLNSLDSSSINFDPDVGDSFFESVFNRPESGYAISFAFGRRHSHKLRSEIEIAVRGNDLATSGLVGGIDPFTAAVPNGNPSISDDDDKITTYSVMKNFIRDFKNRSRFTPYVGAGLGWSYLDIEAPSDGIDEGTGAFTYQAIGGVSTTLNKAVDLVVEYRFLGTSEVEVDDFGSTVAYESHNIFLGLKFEY